MQWPGCYSLLHCRQDVVARCAALAQPPGDSNPQCCCCGLRSDPKCEQTRRAAADVTLLLLSLSSLRLTTTVPAFVGGLKGRHSTSSSTPVTPPWRLGASVSDTVRSQGLTQGTGVERSGLVRCPTSNNGDGKHRIGTPARLTRHPQTRAMPE